MNAVPEESRDGLLKDLIDAGRVSVPLVAVLVVRETYPLFVETIEVVNTGKSLIEELVIGADAVEFLSTLVNCTSIDLELL